MKLITFAGPPSTGKTAVILQVAKVAQQQSDKQPHVLKFDCISAQDAQSYERADLPVQTGLAGGLCPDHYYVSNIEEGFQWARSAGAELLFAESAGLCNRCSPHIKDVMAVCVIDNLSGVHTPRKIGPMLRTADIVVITKADIVSQAEREVFAYRVRQANPKAAIITVNGLTGQGAHALFQRLMKTPDRTTLDGLMLRFTMPAALCSYCLGERKIGPDCQIGNTRTLKIRGAE